MSPKEQIRRIARTAPHFPVMTVGCLVLIFYFVPKVAIGLVKSLSTPIVETTGVLAQHKAVQARSIDSGREYFYILIYEFEANGQRFIKMLEKQSSDGVLAQRDLIFALGDSGDVQLWHDKSNPEDAEHRRRGLPRLFDDHFLRLALLMLAFCKAVMITYYQLRL